MNSYTTARQSAGGVRGVKGLNGAAMIEKGLTGKVYLPQELIELPTQELRKLLAASGYKPDAATLCRIKKGRQDWFLVGGRRGGHRGRRANLGYILLTQEEIKMDSRDLANMIGVHVTTIYKAKRRGWVEVNSLNLNNILVPKDRIIQGDLPHIPDQD